MKPDLPYTRVGPRSGNMLGKSSLWIAADHLLLVINHYFTEDYLRFDLRDIQALVVCRRPRFVIPSGLFFALIAALLVTLTGSIGRRPLLSTIGWTVLIVLGGAWGAVSLWWSCTCHIQTAVGVKAVPSLHRIWQARTALQLLEKRILEVQGSFPEGVELGQSEHPAEPLAESAEPGEMPDVSNLPFYSSAAALAFLFIDAFISWLASQPGRSRAVNIAAVLITILAVGSSVAAAIATRRDKRFASMRTLFLVAVFAVGLVNYGNILMLQMIPLPSARAFGQSMFFWINQTAEIGLGVLGVFLLLSLRRGASSAL